MIPGAQVQVVFSARDAELMLNIAATAVIPNMAEAEGRAQLFQRYRDFMTQIFTAAKDETPAPVRKGNGKGKQPEPPAPDPTT